MNIVGLTLIVCLCQVPADKPVAKVPLGKGTTVVTGPIDKNGYIDYEAALNERLKKGMTPETNANALLWKALGPRPDGARMPAEFFKQMGIEEPPEKGDYFLSLEEFLKKNIKLNQAQIDEVFKQLERASRRPWAGPAFPHLSAWLIVNEKALAVTVEATKRSGYFSPMTSRRSPGAPSALITVLLPGVQQSRALANALILRAMMRLGEGNLDEAWQDLLACHRLARLVARGALLIEMLVGAAIEQIASDGDLAYLERAKLTAAQVRDRLKVLQALPPLATAAEKVDLCERFVYLDCLQMIRRGGFEDFDRVSNGFPPGKPNAEMEQLMGRVDWSRPFRDGNRWYDRIAAAMRLSDRTERSQQCSKIVEDLKALKKGAVTPEKLKKLLLPGAPPDQDIGEAVSHTAVSMMIGGTVQVQNAWDRLAQVRQNLHLAFALAAYRLDNGRYPDKLDALAPKYLAAVPNDMFSGKALIYRLSEDGYLLYSVGVNGIDEGGRYRDDDPPGDDLKVAMPLPALKP
jgi:hypothetical protein